MAQQKKLIERSQERFDLPDFNSLQSFMENDFQLLNQNVLLKENMVLTGFTFARIGGPPSLLLRLFIANGVMINAAGNGSMFVASNSVPNIDLTLLDGTTTYVWLTLGNTDGTPGIRTFRDPNALDGAGAEFNLSVNTVNELSVTAHTSTVGFPGGDPTVIHLCKVTTAAGNITVIEDHRKLFFRLGQGGDTLTPNFTYAWNKPSSAGSYRAEGSPDLIANPDALIYGDKQLYTMKEWMNAVMSQIKEIKFGASAGYWFSPAPGDLSQGYIAMTGGGVFNWNLGANNLSFTQDINFLIPATAFTNTILAASSPISLNANNKVAYVDLDRTSNANLVPTVVLASAFVPQGDRIIIARRISNVVYVGID